MNSSMRWKKTRQSAEGGFNMARSAQSRLFDNIGRRIRHLNEDLRKDNGDLRQAGLERQKENLEKFRDKLREQASKNPDGKLTNEQIYDATDKMKTDDKYTTNKKKIDEITRKMISSEPDEFLDEFEDEDDIDSILAEFSMLSGKYIGQSGDSELRSDATTLIEECQSEINNSELSPAAKETLNKITRELTKALLSKGALGVVFPIGKTS